MSISRYMVALLDAVPIRSGEQSYMDCGFPAALVSRVILRSVRRARTAFWQFSRLPRRPYSARPEPPTRPLTHDHHPSFPGLAIHGLRGRSRIPPSLPPAPQSIAQVHHGSLACIRSSPLYPQTCWDPQTIPRWDRARRSASTKHVYIAPSIPAILPPAMAIRYVKNINLQYKPSPPPPQKNAIVPPVSRTRLQIHNNRFVIRNKLNWFCSRKAARYTATLTARQWPPASEGARRVAAVASAIPLLGALNLTYLTCNRFTSEECVYQNLHLSTEKQRRLGRFVALKYLSCS